MDAEIAAIIMDEGVAHFCYVKTSTTQMFKKVEKSIAKKQSVGQKVGNKHQEQLNQFFEMCFQALMSSVDFQKIKCLILASPGFVKDDFLAYIKENSQREEYAPRFKKESIIQKIMAVHSNTGYLDSLKEIMQDPSVIQQLGDTKAIKETKALEEFYQTLRIDDTKAYYGLKYVKECVR